MAPFASQQAMDNGNHHQPTETGYATRRCVQQQRSLKLSTLFDQIEREIRDDRIVVRKRIYTGGGRYTKFEQITVGDIIKEYGGEYVINLKNGGTLKFMPHYLCNEACQIVRDTMEKRVQYKQYFFQGRGGHHKEPRVHVLLSRKVGTGYHYHG